ncbi:hypothetical protein [Arthrobacter sp. Br18]|uniref:hypothetical protein n=1 Tax=Arthrobacter sp. Br18 TaxID=1312954 RepID=UPI0004ACD17E|nr:hypothetical protein [Arthrobacter sp. Br18]
MTIFSAAGSVIPSGILFPEAILNSDLFAVLSAFVAINTVMYAALSIAKVLPKVYYTDWIHRPGKRSETRSIHPDVPAES